MPWKLNPFTGQLDYFGIEGPAAGVSTDHAVARWDGVGGDLLQNSLVILDDAGNLVMPEDATIGLTDALITFDGSNKDIVLDAGADGKLTVGKTGYAGIEGVLIEKAADNMLQLDFTDDTSSTFLQFTESGTAICQFGGIGTNNATDPGWFALSSQLSGKGIRIFTINAAGGGFVTARFTADAGTQRGLTVGPGVAGGGAPTTLGVHSGIEGLIGIYSGAESAFLVDTAAAKSGGLVLASAGAAKWFLLNRGTQDAPNYRLAFFNATPAEVFTMDQDGNFLIGNNTAGANMAGGLAMALGTEPTGDVANQFALSAFDFAIGNTCPRLRSENGTLIGLNQSLLDNYTPSFAGFAKIGTAADYFSVEADGTPVLKGAATVFNDIYFPMSSGRIGGANQPAWVAFQGNTAEYTFAINDLIHLPSAEISHSYKEGSDITLHVHIVTNGSDIGITEVNYEIEYTIGDKDEVMSAAVVESSGNFTIAAGTPDRTHKFISIGTITGTNLKIESAIKMRFRRIARVGGTGDPAADPFVLMVGAHIEEDTIGSRTENAK